MERGGQELVGMMPGEWMDERPVAPEGARYRYVSDRWRRLGNYRWAYYETCGTRLLAVQKLTRGGRWAAASKAESAVVRVFVESQESQSCVYCAMPVTGEGACQLCNGLWVCSEECWERAARMFEEGGR